MVWPIVVSCLDYCYSAASCFISLLLLLAIFLHARIYTPLFNQEATPSLLDRNPAASAASHCSQNKNESSCYACERGGAPAFLPALSVLFFSRSTALQLLLIKQTMMLLPQGLCTCSLPGILVLKSSACPGIRSNFI